MLRHRGTGTQIRIEQKVFLRRAHGTTAMVRTSMMAATAPIKRVELFLTGFVGIIARRNTISCLDAIAPVSRSMDRTEPRERSA